MFKKLKQFINNKINEYKDNKNKNYIRPDEFIENTKDFINFLINNNYQSKKEFQKRKKGKDYEKYIGDYFENQNFQVLYNGIHKGKKDNKIDLIAIRPNIIYLIQCKNWNTNKYKIDLKYIKKFMFYAIKWIEDNKITTIPHKCLIVMNKPLLDKEAYKYIKNNEKFIEFKIIPFNPNKNN